MNWICSRSRSGTSWCCRFWRHRRRSFGISRSGRNYLLWCSCSWALWCSLFWSRCCILLVFLWRCGPWASWCGLLWTLWCSGSWTLWCRRFRCLRSCLSWSLLRIYRRSWFRSYWSCLVVHRGTRLGRFRGTRLTCCLFLTCYRRGSRS